MQIFSQGIAAPVNKGWPVVAGQVSQLFNYNAKAAIGTTFILPCEGYPFISAIFTPNGSVTGGGTISVDASSDGGKTWNFLYGIQQNLAGGAVVGGIVGTGTAVATAGVVMFFYAPAGTVMVRLRIQAVMAGTGSMNLVLGASAAGTRPDVFVSGFGAAVSTNAQAIANTNISLTTVALQASQTSGIVNATTNRTTTTLLGLYKTGDFVLNITGAGVATGALNIYVQDSADGGTTWDDLVAFPQFAFGGTIGTWRGAVSGYSNSGRSVSANVAGAQQTATLAAGTVRTGPFGDQIKIVEVVSGVSGSPTGVTYKVNGIFKL